MSQLVYAVIHAADGRYGISFPDFPGVVSAAATAEDAVARGRDTLAFHVEGMIEDGETFAVRPLDDILNDPGVLADGGFLVGVELELPGKAVRVNISLEERLLESIDRAAAAAGQSRSAYLADAARARIKVA